MNLVGLNLPQTLDAWEQIEQGGAHACRALALEDRFYLLVRLCGRVDMLHPWIFARCREVEANPDGYLDLWSRDHYKSSVITFGGAIQEILRNPEITIGIFSHTTPIAKAFLRQIKREFEKNRVLAGLFPDILYEDAEKEAPVWSLDAGIIVKRAGNPKESTIEASGLVDGQPISKHYQLMIYDDVVTRDSVSTPDQIAKTTEGWALSENLSVAGGRRWMVGTRYHWSDSYRTILERGAAIPRIHPATEDGTLTGKPVLLTEEQFRNKVRDQGPYVASCQLLLNPTIDSKQTFKREWLRYFDEATNWRQMNRALLIDPASTKKRSSDFTAMAVIAKGPDENYYLLDAVRDRLSLKERAMLVMDLHRKWKPQRVGYEKYGMQADIEYLQELQGRENYRFDVLELGGNLSKEDRVNRLIPAFSETSFYIPRDLSRTLYDGKTVDLVRVLVEEEILAWPVPVHDDLLDAMSRIFDVELAWPRLPENKPKDRYGSKKPASTWMAA